MKENIIIVIIALLSSCSKGNLSEESTKVVKNLNSIELKINDINSIDHIVDVSSYYSCATDLSVKVTSKKNNVTEDLIVFNLTKHGELKSVYFADKSGEFRKDYYSPDFVPSSTITISEFEFIENTKLKFKFNGQLFKKKYDLTQQNEMVQLEGVVEINKFSKNICNTFVNYITLNNNIKFSNITRINENNLTSSGIRYEGYSLNGYNISIKNLDHNLPDLPTGTYSFSNNSVTEKIEFRKYIGLPKSFSTTYIIPSDWILYETQGSFTIVEKSIMNGFQVVKVKLNFTASINGIIEYTFNDVDFITAY
ncbi:hypothetical protein ACR78F_10830 [Sphingobacterium spiritivorum]|uniref:hypothetical protein n=1 Tax=Sphingobacterium spiritivorum TaxID=258 RepID=UPI003DA423B7